MATGGLNLPPSVVARKAKMEENEPQKMSREDWRKEKELEEMRKAGTAPAMKDEEGRDINPHIPQYIMQAPWYFGAEAATLKHQRQQPEKLKEYSKLGKLVKKGVIEGSVATKFRKGACENCGAMTHKKKDCVERPRKVGAKFSGDNFAPDEHIVPVLEHDFSGKRDRWNGYDPDDHQRIHEEWARVEEAKRMLKEEKLDASFKAQEGEEREVRANNSEDEDKYADDVDMPGQKFETKQRITVRNLRIREDTAKYLYNLDPNSAFYDPKTRSMRQNPFENTSRDQSEVKFTGDNFVRFSGDAHEFSKKQVFAWDAYESGTEVHLQADPTKLELLSKEVDKRKDTFKTTAKDSILAKYGGEEHLEAPSKQLLLAQTENYVEYSRHGTIIKGQEKGAIRSKYEEDMYNNNHTSVWGSYWKDGRWGYKCCHSLVKEAYCTGEAGKEAAQNLLMIENQDNTGSEEEAPKSLLEQHQEKLKEKDKKKKKKKKKKKHKKRSSSSSSEEEDEDKVKERKLKEALKKEEDHQKKMEQLMKMDERKRPYNSMYSEAAPTEEEMEAWRLKQRRMDDPMSHFL
ncbi:pre-mRNA-splicing factor SLU7-like [Ylistrum balloti]|uniref:pre-mRNA-splicing factor SLU7-like n=1 Tax=Ylistrum balloti TaxID=509963 RepID=UPI002905B694|nr:pre-mRNA-splicing factor SLU7-like [Ylistrum balloti]